MTAVSAMAFRRSPVQSVLARAAASSMAKFAP
jgi:hypothetical protein